MKHSILSILCTALLFASSIIHAGENSQTPWRSTLYPENWKPGFADNQSRFLHDFSFAGYHFGEDPIPTRTQNIIDATKPPFLADPTGTKDSTIPIQAALDKAASSGGGVVLLPPGTYRIAPPTPESKFALNIHGDNIVLRGAGIGKTFLYNDSVQMRTKRVISISPKEQDCSKWFGKYTPPASTPITKDLLLPTSEIPVNDLSSLTVGTTILIRNDITQRFIDELGMTDKWFPENCYFALIYCRKITSIDLDTKTITIDVPIRGMLKTADNTRVEKLNGRLLQESGIEDLSIGMKQHPGDGLDDDEMKIAIPGTASNEVHSSSAVFFDSTEHCWLKRVASYHPPTNPGKFHLLSHGVRISRSRNISIEDCSFSFPQYLGGGGNGYMYTLYANDCLIKNCSAESGRHNFSFGEMSANGNVIHNFRSKNSRLALDFHMHLSPANLIDNVTCDGDFIETHYRPYGGGNKAIKGVLHGETSTQTVFWNNEGLKYPPENAEYAGKPTKNPQFLIVSEQWGNGYVIGTRGPASAVKTTDFLEGEGKGSTLVPQSLYQDQLTRRLNSSQKTK